MELVYPEVTALKNYEEEVVYSLLNADLDCLSKEALKIGIIPGSVRTDAMFTQRERPSVIRYLLAHVYRATEDRPLFYEQWLHVLSKHVASIEVVDKVRQSFALLTSPQQVSSQTMCLVKGIGQDLMDRGDYVLASTEEPVRVAVGAKRPHPLSVFTERHIAVLSERLTACAGKWSDISIVLGLPEHVWQDLRVMAFTLGSISCFNRLLWEWIVGRHRYAKDPTLENLEQALRSQTVGLGREANHLRRSLNLNFEEEEQQPKKPRHQVSPHEIVGQSHHATVTEGKSPLLEAKKILADVYLAQPEVPVDSWPPRGATTYINLALIKPGKIEKAGEYARNTIQGNVDDIMADKEGIEYDMAFTNLKSVTRFLIEGRPGSGKTTLVHRFSKDWASGNPKLDIKNIELLFLVHLRGFLNACDITLRHILCLYYTSKSTVDVIIDEAERRSGEGLCFILDGLDEYRPKSKKSTFIFKLIERWLFPKALVIIASRPAASAQFRDIADRKIEVIGFLKAQVYEYVEKYPFSETNKEKDLQKYLQQHPNVHHMCYLPIHAAIVCYLFNIVGSTLPRTETEMYTEFTNLTLVRTIRRADDEMHTIRSAEDLPDNEKELFLRICELAFEKTESSKQVMRKNEVSDFFRDVHCGNESMGLITVDSMARKCGFENLYTFLHLTFQEYLAAYHVYMLSETDQLKVLEKYGRKKHMQVVWKFYCGLTRFEKEDPKLGEILKSVDLKKDNLFGAQCAFESQQSITCDYVIQSGECGTLSLQGHYLTPCDLTAVGFVLKNTSTPVEKLVLNGCKFGIEGRNAFLDEAGGGILSVKTLCFHGKACAMDQYQVLNSYLREMTSIEVFDLTNTKLGKKKVGKLTDSLTLPNLRTLKVSRGEYVHKCLLFNSTKMENIVVHGSNSRDLRDHLILTFGSLTALVLRNASSFARVDWEDITLQVADATLVADTIRKQACCTSLNLTNCSIDDSGCKALANGIGLCHTLRELILCNNRISMTGLTEVLKSCCQITSLDVKRNCIGPSVVAIAENMNINNWSNSVLRKLDISCNNIGDTGVAALAHCLKHLISLSTLNLKCTKISDEGAKSLAELFRHLTASTNITGSLQKLDMSYNHISDVGAVALAESIRHLTRLTELNLTGNIIGDVGAEAIISVGTARKNLKLQIANHRITNFITTMEQGVDGNCHILDIDSQMFEEVEDLLQNMNDDTRYSNNINEIRIHISNKITIESLAAIVKCCYKLKTLEIRLDTRVKMDSKILAELFYCCSKKQELKKSKSSKALSECQDFGVINLRLLGVIDANGAKALAEGLLHCNSLQTLNVGYNSCGSDGAKALAEGLQHCNSLQTLNLEGNGIASDGAKALAEGLLHCNSLQTLNVGYNSCGSDGAKALAECLKHCNSLQTLNLRNNSIGSNGAKALAEGLLHCNSLQTLNLEGNSIGSDGAKALAEGLQHCNSLQTLNLEGNGIASDGAKALAEGLQHCNSLQTLNLGYNSCGSDGAKALAKGLQHCNSLQTLNLEGNGIASDGAKALAEGLQHCNSLQTLNLEGNGIASDGAKALAEGLQHCNSLQTLNLEGNGIASDGAKALAEGLQHCNSLQTLNLKSNSIDSDGAKALSEGLQHCNSLQTLNLELNSIGSDGAKALAEGLQHCNSLQTLKLRYNSIGPDGAKALAEGLQHCNSLQTLNLRSNSIGSDGAKALAEGLQHCNSLQTLNLRSNSIGSDGAKALAEGLQHCNSLQTLNIGYNDIGSDGAKALAEGLQHCNSLQTLNLERNSIGSDGAKALAEGLQHCNSLQTLNLELNSIGSDGATALAEGLQHCNSLQTLNIGYNDIGSDGAKALAEGLQHCNSLQTLNLEHNSIGSDGAKALAEGLQHCNSLQTLNLEGNGIASDGAKALAEGLLHCNSLQTLNVGYNSCGSDGAKALAEGLLHCNSLQTLNVGYNSCGSDGAKALAECLKHCNSLQTLNLRNNSIGSNGAKALAEGLLHCNSLQTLNLEGNSIGSDGAKALAEGLQHCNSLQTLNLEGNGIASDGAKALAEGLQHCNSLQTLNLGYNDIGSDGAKALAEGLQHCNSLQTLSLGYNSIDPDGAKALAEGLQHCNSLQTLNLRSNSIGSDGAKALAEGLQHCNSLQTLNIGYNDIGSDGAKALAEGLQHCNSLQTLNLERISIGSDGAKALAEGLQHCNSLQTLNLELNSIGSDGATALAEGLQHCNSLQTLNLEHNSIGSDGAKALAEGLQHCNSLQTLSLGYNSIGPDGAKALAEGLQHCNSLQTLNLRSNSIGSDGAKALAEGLQHCNSLQTLNLRSNSIGSDGAKALAEGLQHCNSLQTLNIGYNDIGSDGAKALAEGLQHCNSLQTLNLEHNSIGSDGAKSLAEGLQHCNSLQTLNIGYNDIGSDGAKALAEGLQHCNSLHADTES